MHALKVDLHTVGDIFDDGVGRRKYGPPSKPLNAPQQRHHGRNRERKENQDGIVGAPGFDEPLSEAYDMAGQSLHHGVSHSPGLDVKTYERVSPAQDAMVLLNFEVFQREQR
jgi:hypothetical protein